MTAGDGVRRQPIAGLAGRRGLFGLIVVLLVAGAVSAWRIRPRSAPPAVSFNVNVRPLQGSSTPDGRPVSAASESARLVPPSNGPCRTADLSLRVVPTSFPDRGGVASVAVTSKRACRLSRAQSVTPLRVDGRAAAPPVVIADPGTDNRAVVVSPGRDASMSIRFFFDPCLVDSHIPGTPLATAFSYDLNGARGTFGLPAPVAACPMAASIDSSDVYNGGVVGLAGPATVEAGGRYDGHVDFHYLDTPAAVFDPCPTISTLISPQSGPELAQVWQVECQAMRPLTYGNDINFDLPLTIPAGLLSQFVDISVGFGVPARPSPFAVSSPPMRLTASQRIWVTGERPLQPVPFMDVPAPPAPALRRTTSPACDVADLAPADLHQPSNGFGGQVSMSFSLVNVTVHPCTLRASTPIRLSAPGRPTLTVPVGNTIVPSSVDGELAPGATTEVVLSVRSSCDANIPVVSYTSVHIELPRGVLVVPFPVTDRCGVGTPGIGINGAAGSTDGPVNVVEMHAPASLARGRATTIQVTLDSFDGVDLGQLSYAVTVAGVETRHGFPTTVIQRLLAQLPTVFDIPVDLSASLPPGPTSLRIEVLAGSVPAAQASMNLT